MSEAKKFRQGEHVAWSSHGATAHGVVVRKLTSDADEAGRVVRASAEEPQYLVRSDHGGEAVHKPEALRKT